MEQPDILIKYQEIIDDIESKIKDPELLRFVERKITALTLEYMKTVDGAMEVLYKQNKIEENVLKIQEEISNIKSDIYIDDDIEDKTYDNDFEFEIICPYCKYEFVTDESSKNKDSIECPKCNNIIELDWKDDKCSDSCESCNKECKSLDETGADSDIIIAEEESENYNNDNEDDM